MTTTTEIELTQGQFAVIDKQDIDLVCGSSWFAIKAKNTYYAMRAYKKNEEKSGNVFMHRIILQTTQLVDHKDGNGLNNSRSNLRPCTYSQNQWNRKLNKNSTSGFKGVSFYKPSGRWLACIRANKEYIHLGYFDTPEEASLAYYEAAIYLHGNFARFQ